MTGAPLPFQPDRFRTAAAHYLAGRPVYAPRLIARVAAQVGLSPAHRLLDLGCGPGQLAAAFAPMVREVIALDPSADMLAAARAWMPANVGLVQGSSYDLNRAFGPVHLVTMGRSFHWMDRADTLRRLDGIVAPGGSVALFHDDHPDVPDNAWQRAFGEVLRRYNDDDPARGRWNTGTWVRHEAFLLDSAFSDVEEITVIERRETPAERLIDRALSLSSTSRERLGDRADALVAELRTLIGAIAPTGLVTEVVATSALIATRPSNETP
jgi:SAM-dependent methyltransferase